jgi:hypothetical protein
MWLDTALATDQKKSSLWIEFNWWEVFPKGSPIPVLGSCLDVMLVEKGFAKLQFWNNQADLGF